LAVTVIFVVAFGSMLALTFVGTTGSNADAALDTCRWLVALTASAIIGLLTRARS
jgi:hypothetical protein